MPSYFLKGMITVSIYKLRDFIHLKNLTHVCVLTILCFFSLAGIPLS